MIENPQVENAINAERLGKCLCEDHGARVGYPKRATGEVTGEAEEDVDNKLENKGSAGEDCTSDPESPNSSLEIVECSFVEEPKAQWTDAMKLTFEKGLVLFGENVDMVQGNFKCFARMKPLELDLYFYSNERQKYIGDVDVSRKIVQILDQTPLKHLRQIEFFELGRDWAAMRQIAQVTDQELNRNT